MKWFSPLLPLLLIVVRAYAQTGSSDPGGVLSQLTVARFSGSGSESIQAMTSDKGGYIYIAGTTSSPDLTVKNAAQPIFGEAALIRSLDRGATWQKIPNAPASIRAVTSHPTDPQTLCAGALDGIYKTTDGGQTWRRTYTFATPLPGTVSATSFTIAIDPADTGRIYACLYCASTARFLASSDSGEGWQASQINQGVPDTFNAPPLWVDPNGSGIVGLGLSLSRDHGKSWTPVKGPETYSPSFLVPDPRHPGWVYPQVQTRRRGNRGTGPCPIDSRQAGEVQEGQLLMDQADRDRLVSLKKAKKKLITQKEAAEELGITERQVRRLLRKLKKHGDKAVVHALRGEPSNRKTDEQVQQRAVEILSRPDYQGFRPTLATEHLGKHYQLEASRETVRKWMIEAKLWKPRRQRVEKVHMWRVRRSRLGELVQWDTSDHDWLEGRGERIKLIAMIDDATSRYLARFVMSDSTEENMAVLKYYLNERGRPLAFYTDKIKRAYFRRR